MKAIFQVTLFVLLLPLAVRAADPTWSIEGRAITADNCAVGCPCILGEPPTHGRCQYFGVMTIEKGHYGDVKLDNVKFALGGAFGRSKELAPQEYDFVSWYVDDSATKEQKEAMKKIFASPEFAGMGKAVEVKEVPISVTGIEDWGKVGKTYGGNVGEFGKVRVTPISGAISGKPMVVENSAEPNFYWTALGKSSESYYKGAGMDWSFSGTSGESHKFHFKSASKEDETHKGHH
jgi:hypothetical protein